MTLLLWLLLPRVTQVNVAISRGGGGPVLTPLLPGFATNTCSFNDPRFLRQGEECSLHAACSSSSHSFTARHLWGLQMRHNLSLHPRKQKMRAICNSNLFVLKQCKATQRCRRAVGERRPDTRTGLPWGTAWWCIIDVNTWNLCGFMSQCHPSTFNSLESRAWNHRVKGMAGRAGFLSSNFSYWWRLGLLRNLMQMSRTDELLLKS